MPDNENININETEENTTGGVVEEQNNNEEDNTKLTERISLIYLTENSVSVLKETFNNKNEKVNPSDCRAYANTARERAILENDLPEELLEQLFEVWGDEPTIEEYQYPIIPIETLKLNKIDEMDKTCHQVIEEGFDIELEDGEEHHFSLKDEDQVLIQALKLKVEKGETFLPYHANGELCRIFTANEVIALNTMMEQVITYNTTYFNSLRNFIQHLDNRDTINSIEWGSEIPAQYKSEVLVILENSLEFEDVEE